MSVISLALTKKYLRVIHSSDDELIQSLLDGAEEEAKRFCNRTQLPTLPVDYPPELDSNCDPISEQVPSSEDPVPGDVVRAIWYLVQADYEGLKPEDAAKRRQGAETLLMPYRTGLGV